MRCGRALAASRTSLQDFHGVLWRENERRKREKANPIGLVPGLLLLAVACGQSSKNTAGDASPADPPRPAAPTSDGGAGAIAPDEAPPPEREVESAFESPVATGNFVWVTNPKSGRVA